ncbi:MAG: isoprenylcysteine carboxylmethyltransferase family protein [Chloroflexota bacterium]
MSIFWLVLSVAIWGIVHSWLASFRAKELFRRWLGQPADRFYRFGYNVFSVFSFLPVLGLMALLPDRALYSIPAPWLYLTLLGQGLAGLVLAVGVLQTDTLAFIGVKQLFGGEESSALVKRGLYRLVRHPLYTGGLLFIWLTPSMTANRLVVIAAATVYILVGAYFEERKLLRLFGREYADYQAVTPMLVPGLKWGSRNSGTKNAFDRH